MTHRMILMSHDFKVLKVVVAKRKHKADVAQVGERIFRTDEVGASTASIGSTFEESE